MDRLGRNTIQLLQFAEHLREKGVHFAVLNLGIDTRTPTGKFFLTVMSAFSELDREMIKKNKLLELNLQNKKEYIGGE